MGWYQYAAQQIAGCSVIDIGCGLGVGLDVLRKAASEARGQDLDARLERSDVLIGPVSSIASKQFDFVTCIDVVEHVDADRDFMQELARIARRGIFLTTPLSILGREVWPFHVREYTFAQFVSLTSPLGRCAYFKGSPSGDLVFEVENTEKFLMFQRPFNHPVTNAPARILQKLLPVRYRNMAHQAARIELPR